MPVGEQKADEETERIMRLARRQSSTRAIRPCWVYIPRYSSQPVQCTDRASHKTHMHAFTHAAGHTYTPHLPPTGRTRFSFSCLFLWPTLSVLSFFLSHYLFLLLPSLFQYPLSFSRLHMQSASQNSPHPLSPSLPPSLYSPPSHAASPSISSPLSLSSVCAEREAII